MISNIFSANKTSLLIYHNKTETPYEFKHTVWFCIQAYCINVFNCQPRRWVSRFFGSRNTLHIKGLIRDFDSLIILEDF